MDLSIAAILAQDGITNGAVYALLAMALVLVFSVTRVIFLPQGEFVGFGALSLAALQSEQFPQLVMLLVGLGVATFAAECMTAWSRRKLQPLPKRLLMLSGAENLLYPAIVWLVASALPWHTLPMVLQIVFVLGITVPMGLMIYRLAYQPVAEASVLVLLIVSVAVHFGLLSLSLLVFGPEGSRPRAFTDWNTEVGSLMISGQSALVVVASAALIALLYLFFNRTLKGKALRATAVNRNGARLVGIGTNQAGRLAFGLSAAIGTLAGVLIGPLSTVQYDTGFVIALKGFVAAIVGGLVSYPLAAVGAVIVGLLESYSSFWASDYKEVIVFTLILPVLAWRSLRSPHQDED